MPRILNNQFLSDPVGFAQNNVMVPNDGSVTLLRKRHIAYLWDKQNPEEQKTRQYYSINSNHRVVFAELLQGNVNNGVVGGLQVDFSLQPAASRFPAFWLPYGQNETVKITLSDKRPDQEVRATGGEVRAFFTSALNGCSVFIEGDATCPTVFHINSGCVRCTTGSPTPEKTRKDRLVRTREQVTKWRMTRAPKRQAQPALLGGPLETPGVVHGDDYLPNYFQTAPDYEADLNSVYQQFALNQVGLAAHQVQFRQVDHSACLFGFKSRHTGRWEFWVQERARVFMKDAVTQASLNRFVGFRLRKVWPGGPFPLREPRHQNSMVRRY